jgi:hypothetical protein
MIFSNFVRPIAVLGACVFGSLNATAADIRFDPSWKDGGAVLEGTIEAGDYDKLRRLIFEGHGVLEIYLASPGGELAEAMKIGQLVRSLKLVTIAPDRGLAPDVQADLAARHGVKDKANYMCASACFFVFVAGVYRKTEFVGGTLGIHRPYLSERELKAISADQAVAATNQTRSVVDKYLREMGVPTKYVDQMFSVPKDQVRWISMEDLEADFQGFIPDLKDWVDARCEKRTDAEKRFHKALEHTTFGEMSRADKIMMDAIHEKRKVQIDCETDVQIDLAIEARNDALGRLK